MLAVSIGGFFRGATLFLARYQIRVTSGGGRGTGNVEMSAMWLICFERDVDGAEETPPFAQSRGVKSDH